MKKQIFSTALGLIAILFSTATFATVKNVNTIKVSETVTKKVSDQFKDVVLNVAENGYTVRSQADGHEVTSAFDKKGNLIYAIEYFTTDNLSKSIVDIVNNNYGNYYISGIEKVTQPGLDDVYIVHIEDTVSIKTIRITGGESELVQDFIRG
ncbi:MAG TPA: hypothetical protein PLA68_08490 [Panacibacter sp.]|nr:hypothetical protein [Panacibacter sp.]